MTRAATAGELVSLRSDGQWARWKAIIDRPDTVYTARATGAVSSVDWSISFDGGSGTLGNCLTDMILLVGSTAGGSERGIARLRKAPAAGIFYIGADDSIICQDNDYLTVINDWAPFAKHPVGELIDFDVAYSDQFSAAVPVPIIGERFQVVAVGGTAHFNAAASWVPGSTISGYAWTFTGASSNTGAAAAATTATYNTAGRYRVILTVTAANGKTNTAYGWVYVGQTPETGVIINDPEGEPGIGWACQMIAYDRPAIRDLARVILYSDDYFANVLGSKGPVEGVENQLVVGWIVGETIIRTPGLDYVEFTVGGPGVFCDSLAALPAGLVDTGFPDDAATNEPAWAKFAGLTVRTGLHYLAIYRSTLATCLDFEVEDWSTPAHKMTSDSESLWAQLGDFANQGVMTVTPDRYGHIYIQRDARLYPYASRTANIPNIMTLTDNDWEGEKVIIRRQHGDAAIVEAEGSLYTGGTLVQVGGRSPGNVPAGHGPPERMSDISWADADEAEEVCGLYAGALNAEYERVSGVLASNNHFIDIAPRQYVTVTIDGATVRTIPRRVSLQRNSESGRVKLDVDLEPEGTALGTVAIGYPGVNEPEPPPEPPPPPPPPPEYPPPPPQPPSEGGIAVVSTSSKVQTTGTFFDASPAWSSEL